MSVALHPPDPLMRQLIDLAVRVHELEVRASDAVMSDRERFREMAQVGRDAVRRGLSVVDDLV